MASISGRVTSDGAGIPDAWIFLEDVEARSEANGSYTITGPAGSASMAVFKEGFRPQVRPIEVPASGGLTEDFELERNPLYDE